jgi:hypothetical protein
MMYAERETLATVLPWEEAKMKQVVEDLPCLIYIESEDPDAMAGVDPRSCPLLCRHGRRCGNLTATRLRENTSG